MRERYWKWYENQVANLFAKLPAAVVERNVNEIGMLSRTKRQIDVRIQVPLEIDLGRGFSISIPVRIIVDCKSHERRLDVKMVESIIGLRKDVGAQMAIVVSPKGVTKAARERGRADGVLPLTVTGDLLALAHGLEIDFSPCLFCENEPESDRLPCMVDWRSDRVGYGSLCSGLHVSCPDCGEIIGIPECQYDRGVCCGAECGSVFLVEASRDEEIVSVFDALESTLLKRAYAKSTQRLTPKEIERIVAETKWQHWDVGRPWIRLTEEGLLEDGDDGSLNLTRDGRRIVERVLLTPEYPLLY